MKLATRLILLLSVAIVALSTLAATSLYALNQSMMNDRRAEIVNMLKMGMNLLSYYQSLEARGSLTREQAQSAAKTALSQLNNDGISYYWARLPNGLTFIHPNPKIVNTITQGETMDGRVDAVAYREAMDKDTYGLVLIKIPRGNGGAVPKLNGIVEFKPWGWWLGTGFYIDDINEIFWRNATKLMGIFVLAIGILVLLGWQLIRSVTKSLGGEPLLATEVTRKIASGDLSAIVPLHKGDSRSLLHAISGMQTGLVAIISGIRSGATNITSASSEIALGNQDLSARTEEQAGSLEEIASSMEQLTSAVRQNAENGREANALAEKASIVAEQGGAVVSRVIDTMASINQSSNRIVDIIGVIDGIAFQTNILALNAAVEAARAGEQGRGFAVVASEVRSLAQRSASAAKEIKTLIADSVEKVDVGSQLVEEAGETMKEVVTSVKQVTHIIAEIAVASREQSAGIEQINTGITQMDNVTQQNAALVEQAAAAAESLKQQAAALEQLVETFKLGQ
ncbi:methyl-accepting chemotaxis protein [Herbaspirillum sp. Sphag1AN]|uniref:methyl-accepting chemotaxis protein n=1 Tax=unclassified Herbaspirillum TaxID=2624150 RepID=UPI001609FE7A|nr:MULTISPECIES: methyl-accepting chemotaxis protein [unclassified Herbaspirillum]MBB3210872.1 methyl-accepting chemotaxis protein [Herbaspirillum sp. Sphag1AN]MBB3244502.1 methyl-accepting chemotaxis protein [Herbaspirillum sp. Sphag64]